MADEKKKQKLRVDLEFTDPKKEGDIWKSNITALVSKGVQAQQDFEVQFYLEGVAIGSPITTGSDGRTTIPLEFKKSGTYLVEAQIADEYLSAIRANPRRIIVSGEENKGSKTAAYIACNQIGYGCKYELLCQIFTEAKTPVPGAMVRVIDQDMPAGYADAETNKMGNVKIPVNLCSVVCESKVVMIKVIGTEAETFKTIYRK